MLGMYRSALREKSFSSGWESEIYGDDERMRRI